jgi:D-3-phosphoglycerate dehydrogenase
MKPRLIVSRQIPPAVAARIGAEFDCPYPEGRDMDGETVLALLAETHADALMLTSHLRFSADIIARIPDHVKIAATCSVGTDHIDIAAARARGLPMTNTPDVLTECTADLAYMLILNACRRGFEYEKIMRDGWRHGFGLGEMMGLRVWGKTLGILGLGRIGLEVAKRARVFGMTLIGNDPFVTAAVAREHDVRLVATEELFRASDYLSLHVGLTPQTHGIVNAANLTLMKKTARIINCARGELIDVPALVAALNKGELAGAALDVFEQEPLRDSPLFGVANVLLTPHIAGSTGEAQEAVGIQIAEQVRAYLKLGVVQNAVNSPSLSHEQYLALAPFAAAAERLGSVLAQLLPAESGGLESITIGYCGALADAATEMVRNAAVAGVLGASEGANRINAQQVAAERGVRVHEEKLPGGGSALSMTLHTREGGSLAARAGVAVDLSGARLLQLEGIAIEAPLEGTLLVVRNSDVPGVIGTLGTVIGEHGINIANFALGRAEGAAHGTALAVIQIDGGAQIDGDAVPALLRQLRAVEAVHEVRCVQLPQQASPLQ